MQHERKVSIMKGDESTDIDYIDIIKSQNSPDLKQEDSFKYGAKSTKCIMTQYTPTKESLMSLSNTKKNSEQKRIEIPESTGAARWKKYREGLKVNIQGQYKDWLI